MADITWLGHSCFRIKGREATIITDPYDSKVGYDLGRPKADIVTISHDHHDHNFVQGIKGEPKVIAGPGEYEISDVLITGIRTYHDEENGQKRGKNTVYLIEMEGVTFCHLGDLGHVLTTEQVEAMEKVDVLFIPVGGFYTINAAQAAEVISELEPKIVIPMHYLTKEVDMPIDPVDKFAKEIGLKNVEPQEKLTVKSSSLPEEMQVVILEYKAG
jgi:L-ascorbate metabolism protein UlaG (beta-lactamase superfamily)